MNLKHVLKRKYLILFCLVAPLIDINAEGSAKDNNMIVQQKETMTVTGTVKDATGEPIIGVSVLIKGTSTGGITDLDGNFSIVTPKKRTILVFTYLGYKTQEIIVEKNTPIFIVMEEDSQQLDEVVVVGYGSQAKISVTGALGSVKNEEILKAPVANAGNALAGRTTGITTVQRSGEPGRDDAEIYVRGIATFADGNAKHKRHDHDHNIKQYRHHRTVTAHVIARKTNCLVQILRRKIFQRHNFSDRFHQVLGTFFLFFFCHWLLVINPRVIVLQQILVQLRKPIRRHDRHSEFD